MKLYRWFRTIWGEASRFHVDDDVHAVAVGVVVHVGDALDALLLHQVGDALDEPGLVHLVGQLGDDDFRPAGLLVLLNLRPGPDGDLPPAGGVGRPDAGPAHDDAPGGEVRPLDVLHELVQGGVGVVDEGAHPVDDLPHVVGRDVGGHAHGDARGAVDQDVGEVGGQHRGLFQTVVVVGGEVHRVLVDVVQHGHRELVHLGLCVPVGGRGVAVDRAEVAVAVHQHVAHGEILGQAHQGVVHRGVAVGMVPAQHGAYGVGALAVGLLRPQGVLIHGVQDAPVHGL